jgi:hypothetical protein
MGNYDLLSGEWMPPLLMASGSADTQKAMLPKNPDHLVRSEPRRPALTQP